MVVQVLFGKCHIFDGDRTFAAPEFNEFIYPNPAHLQPMLNLTAGWLHAILPLISCGRYQYLDGITG
jgi:hypothetical protein